MAETDIDEQQAGPEADGSGDARSTVLADRYRVLVGQPAAEFSTGTIQACNVADTVGSTAAFALLCQPDLPWRSREFEFLQRKPCPGLLPILASGIVPDSQGVERFAVVYRKPTSPAMVPRGTTVQPIPARTVVRIILPQLVTILAALAERSVVHRSIRADNLYAEESGHRSLVLGDCVMAPAGMDQPSVYEPLERALVPRDSRGEGSDSADLYAVGVTMAALVLGKTPGADQDQNTLLRSRVGIGSYRALIGDSKVELGALSTVLRGLLSDQPEDRWDLQTLATWIVESDKAVRPKSGTRTVHNPFNFDNVAYDHPMLLASAMARSPAAAMKVLSGPGLEPWVRNTLRDEKASTELLRLREQISDAKGKRGAAKLDQGEILALACRALDPTGPIRYRGISVMADAMGPHIAGAMAKQDGALQEDLKALLSSGFVTALSNSVAVEASHDKRQLSLLEKAQRWAKSDAFGFGLERCLYGFNAGLSCQSPLLTGKYVLSLKGLVACLENVALTRGPDVDLIDRHVAAFAASRTPRVTTDLAAMTDAKSTRAARDVAAVRVIAVLQQLSRQGKLPGLSVWAHHRLMRVIDSLHSATRRKQLAEKLGKATDQGNLGQMVRVLGFPDMALKDDEQRQNAARIFVRMKRRVADLQNGAKKRQKVAMARSLRLAFLASYFTLICSVGYLTVTYLRMFS